VQLSQGMAELFPKLSWSPLLPNRLASPLARFYWPKVRFRHSPASSSRDSRLMPLDERALRLAVLDTWPAVTTSTS
jgi:hypothetical protein